MEIGTSVYSASIAPPWSSAIRSSCYARASSSTNKEKTMQAKIYISAEAMATVNAIKDLDYYSRVSLSDDGPDLTTVPGYFLNTNALDLAELPSDVEVAM